MGRIIALCVGLVACYSPPRPECGFVCGASGQCPADYACNSADNTCHLNGSPAGMLCFHDAAFHDAPFVPQDSPVFHVVSTSPIDGDNGVDRFADVLATFDQRADTATITNASFLVTFSGSAVPGSVFYDDNTQTARFSPTGPFGPDNTIVVMLTSDIHSSLASAVLSPKTFVFHTIDDVAPIVMSTTPFDMATAVPINSTITVTFSEIVSMIDNVTFAVHQGVSPIPGNYASADSITFTFTPTTSLPGGSVITVDLTAGIHDTTGNPLVPVTFTFTTQ